MTTQNLTDEEKAALAAKEAADALKKAEDDKKKLEGLDPELQKLVQQQVDEQLAKIKKSLDNLNAAKEAAEKRAEEEAQKRQKAEIEKLEAEGKTVEAANAKLKQAQEETEALRKKNVELSRDNEVNNLLSEHPWRSTNAKNMAQGQILAELTQDANGAWVHKGGKSVREFVASFVADEENSFLLKPKQSSGLGGGQPPSGGAPSQETSIFKMSQKEVLERAARGELGNGGAPW